MYIYIYTYVHIYIYVYIHISVRTCIYLCSYVRVTFMYKSTCVCVCVGARLCFQMCRGRGLRRAVPGFCIYDSNLQHAPVGLYSVSSK